MKKREEAPEIDVIEIVEDCAAPSVKHRHCAIGRFLSVAAAEISMADAKALLTIGRAVTSDVKTRKTAEEKAKANAKAAEKKDGQ